MKNFFLLCLAVMIGGCSAADSGSVTPTIQRIVGEVEAMQEKADNDIQATEEAAIEAEVEPEETEASAEEDVEADTDATEEAFDSASADLDPAELLNDILFSQGRGPEILAEIRDSGDTRFVAGLIDALRYQPNLGEHIGFTLNTLTGQELDPAWPDWVEWAGKHPEIESFEGYVAWKANLYSLIDPNFLRFVNKDIKVAPDSRVEEIVWGGVRVDGIPALDNPTMIDPSEADYLVPEERVFGVSINGDTRAYPARFLDWHEMFNDVVGGEPVSLAY